MEGRDFLHNPRLEMLTKACGERAGDGRKRHPGNRLHVLCHELEAEGGFKPIMYN